MIDRLWSALTPDERGLVTAVVQHAQSGQVLMVAMVSRESLARTLERRRVTFWSRSRRRLWEKGETSNNTLDLVELWVDCDGDALVIRARPRGPTCHTGRASCFYRVVDEPGDAAADTKADAELAGDTETDLRVVDGGPVSNAALLDRLGVVIEDRKAARGATHKQGESYVRRLIDGGAPAISAKIEEEAGELIEALCAEVEDPAHITAEAADLLFHVMVGLAEKGLSLSAVRSVLGARLGLSGIDEKARRGPTGPSSA